MRPSWRARALGRMDGSTVSSEETILYIVANESLGWRKIGIGFGSRLEKWRREGWVLEQQALFPSRDLALVAERLVINQLPEISAELMDFCGAKPLDEGHTETWLIGTETIDLQKVAEAVTEADRRVSRQFSDVHLRTFTALGRWFLSAFPSPDEATDRDWAALEELNGQFEILAERMSEALARKFVVDEVPEYSRETLELMGLDWGSLMRRRQEYWEVKRSGPTGDR